ncbi:hypothetical protein GCM10017621_06790 [Maricaulis virginensis]|uniref:Uncharacterized protein n=1 Tax=Maricaulis virginensis TaxID=144022 RepID=A0A9W6ILH8_9PROT|nr:hypothetical protein GCM10017621_06790 [Maricaulis virginensis]
MVSWRSRGKRELTVLRAMPNDTLVRDTPNYVRETTISGPDSDQKAAIPSPFAIDFVGSRTL